MKAIELRKMSSEELQAKLKELKEDRVTDATDATVSAATATVLSTETAATAPVAIVPSTAKESLTPTRKGATSNVTA